MKKLMIAAAIVCAAAMSQAAQFKWMNSTGANWVDNSGVMYNKTDHTAPGSLVLVLLGTDGTADWSKAAEVADQTGTFSYSTKGGAKNNVVGTYSFTYGDSGTPQNNYVYGVMFKDGKTGELSQLVDATTGNALAATYTVSGLGDNAWAGADYYFASANYTTASVPEPTSGLLLLLGVAGMALRRKQK